MSGSCDWCGRRATHTRDVGAPVPARACDEHNEIIDRAQRAAEIRRALPAARRRAKSSTAGTEARKLAERDVSNAERALNELGWVA